ncbi:eukaryotic translation initiation factor 1-like protein [Hyaloraphidium curvatum]|nr:eukaryotic translation initiation factor 1-like protein [Hyaloraphidium curvatum]
MDEPASNPADAGADAPLADASPPSVPVPPTRVLKDVLYCGVCTLPPEFCEFDAKTLPRCKAWLKEHHGDVYDVLYAADAAAEQLSRASLAEGEEPSGPAPEQATAEPKKDSGKSKDKKKKTPKVVIETVSRNKRKHVTIVVGLDAFDIDLKKAAKTFANKFACGSSVTKNAEGKDEIVVQGEFAVEIAEMLEDLYSNVPPEAITIKEPKTK